MKTRFLHKALLVAITLAFGQTTMTAATRPRPAIPSRSGSGGFSVGGSSGGGLVSFQQSLMQNIVVNVNQEIQQSTVQNTRSETFNNVQTRNIMPTVTSSGTGNPSTVAGFTPGTTQYTNYLNTVIATVTNPGNSLSVTIEISDADILKQARELAAAGKAVSLQQLVDKYPKLAVSIAGAVADEATKIADKNGTGAADVAAVAALIVSNKNTVNANPALAASVAASVAKVAANPVVAAASPVLSALISVQANYVVNTPVVANDPALAQKVQDTRNAVDTVRNNATVIASVPTLGQRLNEAAGAGQKGVNVTSIVKTPASSDSGQPGSTPPTAFDVSIRSGSG